MLDLSEIKPDVVAFLRASLEMMPYSALVEGAKRAPELMQGLNQKQPNEEQLRKRVQARLNGKKVPPEVTELLRKATHSEALISVLSERAILQGLHSHYDHFGKLSIVAAMAVDERESIRAKAKSEADTLEESPSKPAVPFETRFQPLLTVLRRAIDKTPEPVVKLEPSKPSAPALTPSQIENLVTSHKLYQQSLREKNDFKQKHEAEKLTSKKLSAELDKTKAELTLVTAQVKELEEHQRNKIAAGIADALSRQISPWLNRTEQLAKETPTNSDPMKFAKDLLEQQAKVDQRFGTRTIKQAELGAARDMFTKLKAAEVESLRPLPQLREAILGVQDRIIHLEKLLDVTSMSCKSIQLQTLQKSLAGLETLDQLKSHKANFEDLARTEIWGQESIKEAFWLFDKEATRIYDKTPIKGVIDSEARITSLQRFQNCLLTAQPLRVLVDGHNFLFTLRPLLPSHNFSAGVPNKSGRTFLISLLDRLSQAHPLLDIDIWFDGPDEESWTVSKSLRVWFSGGTGQNRADEKILESLKALEYQGSDAMTMVISDDGDLQIKAKKLKAVGLSNLEAWSILK